MAEDERTTGVTEQSFSPSDPALWEELLGGRTNAAWLLQDPEVDALLRQGRVDLLYELFRKRLSAAPTVEAHALLESALANRRLFLQPLRDAPGLGTLNGIGARTYGSQERNLEDGTYITTRFLTLLYLPLWPLAEYLVAKAPSKGWYFLGRVPLSAFHRWWRRAVLVGVVAVVFAIGLSTWRGHTTSEVHFLNGLPVPVTVTMGGEVIEVGAAARATRVIEVGPQHVTARGPGGAVLEERDVDVPRGQAFVAYNVLGAAPLVLETMGYTAEGADPTRGDEMTEATTLAGESWVVQAAVDWLFRPAPRNLPMPAGTLTTKKRRLDVYEGGWRLAAAHLLWENRASEAAALARTVVGLVPGDAEALEFAVGYTLQAGEPEVARDFLQRALVRHPDDLQLHRRYQSVMQSLGRVAEIEPDYRAAYEKDPHSARAGYLYARILDAERALPILEALTDEHPDDPWVLRGLAWVYYMAGRFDAALPHHTRLLALRPDEAGYFVGIVAQELVAVGRVHDALQAVGYTLDAAPEREAQGQDPLAGTDAWTLLKLYARLRLLAPNPGAYPDAATRWRPFLQGESPTPELIARTAARGRNARAVGWAQDADLPQEVLDFCRLNLLARSAPEEAAALALKMEEPALLGLDDEVQVVLACELHRQGEREQVELVLRGLSPLVAGELQMSDLDALPTVDGLSEELEPVIRAAVLVAASRRVEDESEREVLLAEARRLDVLRLVVPD